MKTKPRTRMVVEEIDELSPSDVSDIADEIMSAFDDGSADRWLVRVYQREGNEDFHLFDCRPDEVENLPNVLRDTYGTGKFHVVARRNNMIFRKKLFCTKAPPGWRAPKPEPEKPAGMDPGFAAILQRMDERAERNERAMSALLERLATPPAAQTLPLDPFAMQEKMLSSMKTMFEMTGGAKSDTTFEAVMKGVELADKLKGKDGESNFYDIVRDALGALPALAEAAKAFQPPQPLPAQPALPRQSAPPAAQSNPAMPEQLKPLLAQLQFLAARAEAGSDPALYADVLADTLPREMLTGLLAQPGLLAQFEGMVPAIAGHREWFDELLDGLRQIMAGEESLHGDDEGPSSGAASSDASSRASATTNGRDDPGRSAGRPRNPKADAPARKGR